MKRTHVNSSAIRSIGYDAHLHLLEIEYVSGEVYLYYYVPETEFEQLIRAESKGTYVNQRIKRKYPYR